jgi:hypothetical protein
LPEVAEEENAKTDGDVVPKEEIEFEFPNVGDVVVLPNAEPCAPKADGCIPKADGEPNVVGEADGVPKVAFGVPKLAAPVPNEFEGVPKPAAPVPNEFEGVPKPAVPVPNEFEGVPKVGVAGLPKAGAVGVPNEGVPNGEEKVPNEAVLVPRATGVDGRAKEVPIEGVEGLSGVGGRPYVKVRELIGDVNSVLACLAFSCCSLSFLCSISSCISDMRDASFIMASSWFIRISIISEAEELLCWREVSQLSYKICTVLEYCIALSFILWYQSA